MGKNNDIFNKVFSDKEIIDRYKEVTAFEIIDKGWAYHNYEHVSNVTHMVEKILSYLNYDEEFIENAKIAAILHDTGANKGKDGHSYRSYEFASDYFKRKNIHLKYEEEVLEAIKIHSDGFDTDNIMALAIILSDKLDVKSNRITEVGKTVEGNRQFQYVKDIDVKIENNEFIVNFIIENNNFDREELEEFYFTEKIFKAIKSFSKKLNLKPVVLIDNKQWHAFK